MHNLKKVFFSLFVILNLLSGISANGDNHLRGITNDSTIKSLRIINYSPLWRDYASVTTLKQQVANDKIFDLEFNLKRSEELTLSILSKNIEVYATPDDDIRFEINRVNNQPQIKFTGKNAAQYNYNELSSDFILAKLNFKSPLYKKEKGIEKYRVDVEEWFNAKKSFFEKYVKDNRLSHSFIEYYRNKLNYQYIQFLYEPVYSKYILIQNVPQNYFLQADSILSTANFAKTVLHDMLVALTYKYIFCSNNNPWEAFDENYALINQKFKGAINRYLITNLIGIYGKAQLPGYKSSLLKTISYAESTFKDTVCLKYIKQAKLDYLLLNQPIPKDVLDNTFLLTYNDGKKITLNEFMAMYAGKPLYIDFWANWCTACREDIADSEKAKSYLTNKMVSYVYISIDKYADIKKWKDAAVNDAITENQYLLLDGISSPLAKFLKLSSIPRYLILNNDHILKNYDAPRPTGYQLKALQTSVSSALQQAVTFK